MTYRIKVNGSLVQPSDESHWGLDTFDGRRIIPAGKDQVSAQAWGPGTITVPGPPHSSMFKLSFWVMGDGNADTLEERIDSLMHFFRHVRHWMNFDFEWESHATPARWNHCKARIISGDVTYESDAHNARVTFIMENLGGVWRNPTQKVVSGLFGTAVSPNAGDAGVFDATYEVKGPVQNPVFTIGGRWLKWTGTVQAGKTLVIKSHPLKATIGSTVVSQNLSWWGVPGRGLDIYPGETIQATAAGTTSTSGWTIRFHEVHY